MAIAFGSRSAAVVDDPNAAHMDIISHLDIPRSEVSDRVYGKAKTHSAAPRSGGLVSSGTSTA